MTKTHFFHLLEKIAQAHPELASEIEKLALLLQATGGDPVDPSALRDYLNEYPALAQQLQAHLPCAPDKRDAPKAGGKIFPVHKPYSNEIRQRMKLAERDEHYRNWANAMKAMPEYTLPLPDFDGASIRRAKEIWRQNIWGNEEILQTILRHSAEYSKSGKTVPILLVGEPGVGKTLVAKNYGRILNLPGSFVSGPSASLGRGLSGAPNLYVGAGVGAIAQAMIDHGAGNPVICIDEIEKATGGHSLSPGFHNELLAALDDSNSAWRDNFLEIDVDASHIPFIFTANDKNLIPNVLLDRMEVVKMESPTREMLHNIVRKFTLPRALKAYDSERIAFAEHEADMLVDMLWDGGSHSCRAYQKAIDMMVSAAYLDAVENDKFVQITERDVKDAVEKCSQNARTKSIGFNQ